MKNRLLKNIHIKSLIFNLIIVFFVFISNTLVAQSISDARRCISQEISKELASLVPEYFHKQTPEPLYEHTKDAILVIPVVVHIVHMNGEENLDDHYIYDQIEVLNEDFGKMTGTPGFNDNPVGSDTRIRFMLARFDPEGNPTNGINRIVSEHTDMSMNNEMYLKNLIRWDTGRFLNIWVVRSISGSSGTLGYAYFPENAAGREMDGVVLDYRVFGRNKPLGPNPSRFDVLYNGGRVLTHEIGHYLDLIHTWGGIHGDGSCSDNDRVHDTPDCEYSYYSFSDEGCPAPNQCGNRRMIENYMDYSSDDCMNIFTKGQKDRMRRAISIYRNRLISYENLVRTGTDEFFIALNVNEFNTIDVFPNPWFRNSHDMLYIYALLEMEKEVNINMYNFSGKKVAGKTIMLHNGRVPFNPDLSPGIYILHITTLEEVYTFKLRVF